MIKIEIREDRMQHLELKGECMEIAAEVGVAVGAMYNKIRMAKPEAAERFKGAVLMALLPFSPAWEKRDIPGGVSQCVTVPKPRKAGGE